jgi:endonuclease/exonuclease/phosphatase family metal-dependent hydrolase
MKLPRLAVIAAVIAVLATLTAGVSARAQNGGVQPGVDTSPELPGDGVPLCGVATPDPGVAAQTDDGKLRVASFNLLHSQTAEGDETLEARVPLLADALVASGADVIGSQEVAADDHKLTDPRERFEVVTALAGEMADRTGTDWEWCWSQSNPHVPGEPDLNEGGGGPLSEVVSSQGGQPGEFREGLAVLSRFDITASRFRRLTPRSYEAPACLLNDTSDPEALLFGCALPAFFDSRQVLWARIDVPGADDDDLDLFTTHVAHGLTELSDTTKALQVQLALQTIEAWATPDASTPDFLVGDFNTTPDPGVDGSPYQAVIDEGFTDTYRNAPAAVECSAPGVGGCTGGPVGGTEVYSATDRRAMSERIDYIFARQPQGCALRVQWSQVIGDQATQLSDGRWLWPSDHNGVASQSKVAC